MPTERSAETYTISDAEAQRLYVGARRATQWVPFFLPHLRPGMSLLDCGCGVGSITLDLAEIVEPGRVVGIDLDERQLAIARQAAVQRGLTNITFQQGSVYNLPFDDGAFDAVLAHTLLFHLSDPVAALTSMRRVLKSGGVAGVSDDDDGTVVFSPDDPAMRRFGSLVEKLMRHNGADPTYSRHLRGLLLQAGFVKTEGFAVAADYAGNLAATRQSAAIWVKILRDRAIVGLVTGQGWAVQAELDELAEGLQRWGESPDAFFAVLYCAALGWTE
jgi:SAM-dependent methyltransferase